MAHFAKLDENNIVKAVVVVSNDVATDEAAGIAFLQKIKGNFRGSQVASTETSFDEKILLASKTGKKKAKRMKYRATTSAKIERC